MTSSRGMQAGASPEYGPGSELSKWTRKLEKKKRKADRGLDMQGGKHGVSNASDVGRMPMSFWNGQRTRRGDSHT